MSDEVKDIKMEVMEPELMLESDKTKGINQPGLTQGVTYTDCNGNIRHKYETLEVLSNRSTTKKVESDEKDTPKVEDKAVEKPIEPVAETPTATEPEDTVEVDSVVEEVKPEPKPKVAPKPAVKKAVAKKPVAKTTK